MSKTTQYVWSRGAETNQNHFGLLVWRLRSLVLNTNVNVEIQELNVKEVLLANPSVVMLLMLNTKNTLTLTSCTL